ncbi:MAG: hypothetical protein NT090_27210 [Acidobacteria bacterium]|nr:hypothetical protein [Acidobacteriota bacterium]
MNRSIRFCAAWAAFGLCAAAMAQTLPSITATPATLSFSYQLGAATLPVAQALAIKRSPAGTALDFTVTVPVTAPWLIVTPSTGKTGTSVSVRVNPTSLPVGAYSADVTVSSVGALDPMTVSVALAIKNPPPKMTLSPVSLPFTYVTDQSLPVDPQYLTVATDGEPLSFTAAVSGGTWLAAAPALGIAVAGSPVTLTVSVVTAGLLPGSYSGKVTLTSANASNKSAFVTVLLTVGPGLAVVSSIWPNAAPVGSNDQTVTIRGSHLFKASVVQAGTTTLTTTWISTDAMLAVIPKASLLAPATLSLTVTNAPQPASTPGTFTVTPLGPLIQAVGASVGVVNAASFKIDSPKPLIAPGEILSIFGSGLGPTVLVQSTPVASVFPTTVGTPAAKVEFGTVSGSPAACGTLTAAPIIFAQANQINAVAPFALTSASGQCLLVTYNGISSPLVAFDRVTANPGLFTIDSSGRGQAAAFNYDAVKGYTLNSAANPAPKDSTVVLYGTGGGVTNPLPASEGQVIPITGAVPVVVGTPVAITIGGEAASVLSITAVPGSIAGLMQLNVTVPSTVRTAKDAAVVLSIGGHSSNAYATLAVK